MWVSFWVRLPLLLFRNYPMSRLIYQSDENMGKFHWETSFYASDSNKELSITQTWFDNTKILLKSNVIVTKDEIENVIRRLNSA